MKVFDSKELHSRTTIGDDRYVNCIPNVLLISKQGQLRNLCLQENLVYNSEISYEHDNKTNYIHVKNPTFYRFVNIKLTERRVLF